MGLEDIKEGDEVIRTYGDVSSVRRVDRVTNLFIVLSNGERFRRSDGRQTGETNDHWGGRVWIKHNTEEARIAMQEQAELAELKAVNWRSVAPALRHQIVELLKGAWDDKRKCWGKSE